jgi:hypothetical protein
MADLRNLTSVFEIGFAIHFAFSLFEQLRQRAIDRQMLRVKQLDDLAGARMEEWAAFKVRVEVASASLRTLTLLCSWISFIVALMSLAILLWVGFSPGETVKVSHLFAGVLVTLSLLPLPLLVLIIEQKSRSLEDDLEEHHRFFAWITAMYGPGSPTIEPDQQMERSA